ncbi:hypothetical protein DRQ18_00520 [bacterium]|nr:MAG: hypothetical protein DRQ18_00520 [bacterium]
MKAYLHELESATEWHSRFVDYLRTSLGERERVKEILEILKKYCELYNLETEFLNFFEEHQGKILVEIPPDARNYLREFLLRVATGGEIRDEDKSTLSSHHENAKNHGPYFPFLYEISLHKLAGEVVKTKEQGKNLAHSLLPVLNEVFLSFPLSEKTIRILPYMGYPEEEIALSDVEEEIRKRNLTPELFLSIHQALVDEFSSREEQDILSLLERTEILTISDVKAFPYHEFLRFSTSLLDRMAKIINKKAKDAEKVLRTKDREIDILDKKVKDKTKGVLEHSVEGLRKVMEKKGEDVRALLEEASSYISELQVSLKEHLKHVEEHYKKAKELGERIEENRLLQRINGEKLKEYVPSPPAWEIEGLVRDFWKSTPYRAMISPKLKKVLHGMVVREYKKDKETIEPLRDETKRGFAPDVDKVIESYEKVFSEVLEPIYISSLLKKLVVFWPPEIDEKNPRSMIRAVDFAHWAGIDLIPHGRYYRLGTSGKVRPSVDEARISKLEELGEFLRRKFYTQATILVYDIRGSTFMSHRLRNAEKQRMIINLFHSEMLEIAKKKGAFLLKEMGDGGIFWFGANSQEIYASVYKEKKIEGGKMRYLIGLEEELQFLKDTKSAEKAIECAIEMVRKAEEFVKENYIKYRDWFGEVVEREISHEGINYALLPPEFKALFRVGVGIASGEPGRDFVFGLNSYGDPDLTGLLVNDASIFSTRSDPNQSVIIIDHPTLFNLILNAEKFHLGTPVPARFQADYLTKKIVEILKEREGERTYLFDNFYIRRFGIYYMLEKDKSKSMRLEIPDTEFEIDEEGILYLSDQPVKILYEVSIRETEES